jgi:serine/threonine-protein kinase
MSGDRLRRLESLFHEALALPPERRGEYVAKISGQDEDLKRDVESLLAHAPRADSFLESPAAFPLTAALTNRDGRRRTAGERVGHYVIGERLGTGGMGEVYRALDTRLDREVALKVLPQSFVHDPDRLGRFQREAKILAALNHPNIAHIHGLEESDGVRALVMELVEGEDLAQRLTRGAIPIDETLRIAMQIAEALKAAHERGILHRDIKPANVKITPDHRVKVLDFGLAKRTLNWDSDQSIDTSPALTAAGVIVGTPAYMSPEQIRAQVVDRRTDIWAFGCVLYEMLTCHRPFDGEGVMDIAAAILRGEPDWTRLPPVTPPAIRTLLRSCLIKDVQMRLGGLSDVAPFFDDGRRFLPIDAQTRDSQQSRVPQASIAVLPFANASGDSDTDYLSDGLTESIIAKLSQLTHLRVMSKAAVGRYKGHQDDALEAGRELGVTAVLSGSVLERKNRLLVTVELVDVAQGWQLWGGQYRRSREDIFTTEDEIAKEIVEKLLPKLSVDPPPIRRYTDNVAAYHLYLRGRFYWAKRTEQGLRRAIQYFHEAIEQDPTYALAYGGLAEGYVPLVVYCHLPAADGFPKARAAAEMALAIDSNLAEARTVMASYNTNYEWNLAAAEAEVRAALAANPKYSRAWQMLAGIEAFTGRSDDAEAHAKQALDLDPLALSLNAFVAMNSLFARRYDTAIEYGIRTVDMDPTFFPGYFYLGLAYQLRGRLAEAITTLQKGCAIAPESTLMMATLGAAYAAVHEGDEAAKTLDELDRLRSTKYVSEVALAAIHLGLGHDNVALECLECAYADRCYWLLWAVTLDARFDPLRTFSRFTNLRRQMGITQLVGSG